MRIISRKALKLFWDGTPQARAPLLLWFGKVRKADWATPSDVKAAFGPTVDFVGDNRAIFDIGGNKYRLVVHIAYAHRRVLIKFIGPHKNYDKIDPETV